MIGDLSKIRRLKGLKQDGIKKTGDFGEEFAQHAAVGLARPDFAVIDPSSLSELPF